MSYLSEFIDYLGRPAITFKKEDSEDLFEEEVDTLEPSTGRPVHKQNIDGLYKDKVGQEGANLQVNDSQLTQSSGLNVKKEGESLEGINGLDVDDLNLEPADNIVNTVEQFGEEIHHDQSSLDIAAVLEEKNREASVVLAKKEKINKISVHNSENIPHNGGDVHNENQRHEAVSQVQNPVNYSTPDHNEYSHHTEHSSDKSIKQVAIPIELEGERRLYESGNINNFTESYSENIQNSSNNYEIKNQTEIPQVRIGQINVVVHDDTATRKRSVKSQKTSLSHNEFGLRGL